VREWLAEDIPSFDYGGAVVGNKPEEALLLGKARGVLAGVPFFQAVFDEVACSVSWNFKEGDEFDPYAGGTFKPVVLASVTGPCRQLLIGERTALNILSRACGIATQARKVRDIAIAEGWKGSVAGTRKTTPGLGLLRNMPSSLVDVIHTGWTCLR